MAIICGYSVDNKLDVDSYTDVYEGTLVNSQQSVLLKMSSVSDSTLKNLKKLQQEYHLLKQIDSPYIIKPIKYVKNDKRHLLVLEGFEGISLKKYISDNTIDLSRFFKIAIQLISILDAMHQKSIIHKNFNPDQILIDSRTLNIKLVDINIASQITNELLPYLPLEQIESSLAYISPELTGRTNRPLDYRTDFYSLGITFYEMLTGELPFQYEDTLELVHAHMVRSPKKVNEIHHDIPIVLSDIVDMLLEKNPENRYRSINGLMTDIETCQKQWDHNKQIIYFSIGKNDVYETLHISHKLYGREKEVESILSIFDIVSNGESRLLMVSGYSGIGKTSVIKEIYKPVVQQQGYMIQGKFDQLLQSTPYSAIVNAFKNLITQILAEPNKKLNAIRSNLIKAIGNIGQVIVEVIPDIELIIGKQPPIPSLGPLEAQNRFNFVFSKFIQTFATKEHPLVIFLDDLQWVDSASLKFMENLILNPETKYLLIIGAYRDNEVKSNHPLSMLLHELRKSNIPVEKVNLNPLPLNDINELIADTFSHKLQNSDEFANILLKKTKGNPFYIGEFLKNLYEDKILIYSHDKAKWQCDLKKVNNIEAAKNVVDFLVKRLHKFPKSLLEILTLCACLGYRFSLNDLITISNKKASEILEMLWKATQENLIIITQGLQPYLTTEDDINNHSSDFNYQFIHDRVQQACNQLVSREIQSQLHLQIGRLMLKTHKIKEHDEYLFSIMDHFEKCIDLVSDPDEKKQIATLSLFAAKKAKSSTAYHSALNYIRTGLKILKPLNWEKDYKYIFPLKTESASCHYLTGEFEKAKLEFKELLKYANDIPDKVEVHRLNCEMLGTLNQHVEAVKIGLDALQLLGIKIPANPHNWNILKAIFKIKAFVKKNKLKNIELKRITNKKYKTAIDLLAQLYNSAYITNQKLFALIAANNVYYSLRYGFSESSTMSLLVYAFVLMHHIHWYNESLLYVNLYNKVKSKIGEGSFEGKNYFVLSAFIEPYRSTFNKSLNTMAYAYTATRDAGDPVYNNYTNLLAFITALMTGEPITDLKHKLNIIEEHMADGKISDFSEIIKCWKYAINCIAKNDKYDIKIMQEEEQKILSSNNLTEICFFYNIHLQLCFFFGFHSEAEDACEKYKRFDDFDNGLITNVSSYFYSALNIAANINKHTIFKKPYYLLKLIRFFLHFKRWNQWNSKNYKTYYLILKAEILRILKFKSMAITTYEKSIQSSIEQNCPPLIIISNYCASKFYLANNLSIIGNNCLNQAIKISEQWGMSGIQNLLLLNANEGIPQNGFEQKTSIAQGKVPQYRRSLDTLAMFKLTQSISSEIHLDRLLKNIVRVVIEFAGAQRCVILVHQKDEWFVEAEGNTDKQSVYSNKLRSLQNYEHISLTLFNYIQRKHETIIIPNAMDHVLTMNDHYIRTHKLKSLLMMPIYYQGSLRRILYLENNVRYNAFSAENLEDLQVIVTQSIVSLENALLFYQASHDTLTGLSNRELFTQLFHNITCLQKNVSNKMALLYIDLDEFKLINDTLGHEIGDDVLITITKRIRKSIRSMDIAARIGGDEFVILLTDINNNTDTIDKISKRLLKNIQKHININKHKLRITTSIGVSIYPDHGKKLNALIKRADMALYQAKQQGKNNFAYYSHHLELKKQAIYKLEMDLQKAFEKNEFEIYYQPIFNVLTNKINSLEALIRWNHPQKGLLDAGNFIELLEKSPLIMPLGSWVLSQTCQQAKNWLEQGILNIPIAVNVSPIQLEKQALEVLVPKILNEKKLNPKYLELEITETAFIQYNHTMVKSCDLLHKLGVHLVIDDFGTGYSSFNLLKQLPVSTLKIDRSYIIDSLQHHNSRALLESIVRMAHHLGLSVIAEGIETKQLLDLLYEENIEYGQGFYLAKPQSVEDITKLLKSQ